MGVIAESEVGANRDAGGLQLLDLLEEARWINDQPIGNDRLERGAQDTRRQKQKLVGFPFGADGRAGIGTAVIANDQVVLFGEEIDDLAFGLVAPLQADDTGAGHCHLPTPESWPVA